MLDLTSPGTVFILVIILVIITELINWIAIHKLDNKLSRMEISTNSLIISKFKQLFSSIEQLIQDNSDIRQLITLRFDSVELLLRDIIDNGKPTTDTISKIEKLLSDDIHLLIEDNKTNALQLEKINEFIQTVVSK